MNRKSKTKKTILQIKQNKTQRICRNLCFLKGIFSLSVSSVISTHRVDVFLAFMWRGDDSQVLNHLLGVFCFAGSGLATIWKNISLFKKQHNSDYLFILISFLQKKTFLFQVRTCLFLFSELGLNTFCWMINSGRS